MPNTFNTKVPHSTGGSWPAGWAAPPVPTPRTPSSWGPTKTPSGWMSPQRLATEPLKKTGSQNAKMDPQGAKALRERKCLCTRCTPWWLRSTAGLHCLSSPKSRYVNGRQLKPEKLSKSASNLPFLDFYPNVCFKLNKLCLCSMTNPQ